MGLRCAMNRSGLSQAVRNMEAEKPKCPLCGFNNEVSAQLDDGWYHCWGDVGKHHGGRGRHWSGVRCATGAHWFRKDFDNIKDAAPQQIRVKRIDHNTVPAVVEGLDENFEPKTETLMLPRNRKRKMDANGNWIEKTDDGPGLLARAVFWVVTSAGGTAAGWVIQYWWNQGW